MIRSLHRRLFALTCVLHALPAQGPLAAPAAPPENPTTVAKAVLGKALFWEEQLSSTGRVACGTCHLPEHGGGDARRRRHPGPDGLFLTPDDTFGSPGIERRGADGSYVADPAFGTGEQVTRRAAPGLLQAAWFDQLFWDGRIDGTLTDPLTGAVVIAQGAALEALSLHPLRDEVEMSRPQRGWNEITQRLALVRPLALASDLPPDLQAAIQAHQDYPGLFANAFGDAQITPVRIAMAIASYLRSAVPDQTPWDLYVQNQPNALTPAQQAGLGVFENDAKCGDCHSPGLFSDREFRALGLSPVAQDPGRGGVTGIAADDGAFKVPSLRNAALKSTFMHNGRFTTMLQVVNFYRNGGGTASPVDPLLQPFSIDAVQTQQLLDFLENGLVDPRVRNGSFPFDRPTLHAEVAPIGSNLYGTPTSVGSITPALLAQVPAYLGNGEWGLGVESGPPGAAGLVVLDLLPAPAGGGAVLQGATLLVALQYWLAAPLVLDAGGLATWRVPLPNVASLRGVTLYAQGLFPAGSSGDWSATRGATLQLR